MHYDKKKKIGHIIIRVGRSFSLFIDSTVVYFKKPKNINWKTIKTSNRVYKGGHSFL